MLPLKLLQNNTLLTKYGADILRGHANNCTPFFQTHKEHAVLRINACMGLGS
jgi:hypothetical protein